jgi:hypothetical protein
MGPTMGYDQPTSTGRAYRSPPAGLLLVITKAPQDAPPGTSLDEDVAISHHDYLPNRVRDDPVTYVHPVDSSETTWRPLVTHAYLP